MSATRSRPQPIDGSSTQIVFCNSFQIQYLNSPLRVTARRAPPAPGRSNPAHAAHWLTVPNISAYAGTISRTQLAEAGQTNALRGGRGTLGQPRESRAVSRHARHASPHCKTGMRHVISDFQITYGEVLVLHPAPHVWQHGAWPSRPPLREATGSRDYFRWRSAQAQPR